ncbi:hypothetical protein WJX79_008602 [Trebouxia sp. C0005]
MKPVSCNMDPGSSALKHEDKYAHNEGLLWTEIDLDVVDALARTLGRKELATFRLICAAWKASIDCCIKQLRPQVFMPKELATSFKAINRLDLHALDDVTDKQLQDLAAAQHVPHEDDLLAQALRKLHGGSICSRSECPSVTGTLSRAESFDMDDNMSEATSSTSVAKQLTPLRRRLSLPHRAAASHHSSKASMESLGSPFASSARASSARFWLPPKLTDLPTLHTADLTPNDGPPPLLVPNIALEQPLNSQMPPTPLVNPSGSPLLQSFHSAACFSTQSMPSQHANSHQGRPPSGRLARMTLSAGSVECLGNMTGLQNLSATLCNWTPTNQPLASALSKLKKLTELRLANSQSLQDQELAELLPHLTLLQRLDLAECYKLTEGGVKALDFPLHLTALNLSRVAVNDTAVKEHLCKLIGLKHLSIMGCHQVSDTGIKHLAQSARELVMLDVSSCRDITDGGLAELSRLCHLQILVMNTMSQNVTGAFLSKIQGLDKLNTISCANCTGFSSAAVRAIGSMHGLVELNLRGYMPLGSLQSLTALQALTGVEALNLARWPVGGYQEQAVMSSIGHMWRLTQLDLADSLVSSKGLRELVELQHLARLSLKCCANVNDQALKAVGQITSLTWLNLHYCKAVSDKGLMQLANLTALIQLDIGFCGKLTDRGVAYLAGLPCLTHVRMAGCHRIKLYQESRESSGKVDIQQWADYAQPPSQRKQWSCSFKKMLLCTCSSAEADQ